MSRVKDLYIELHEKAIADYLDAHPGADDEEAYEATGQTAYDAIGDHFADMADHYHDMMKEQGL